MRSRTLYAIKDEAEEFGIFKKPMPGTHAIKWYVKCRDCNHELAKGWGPTTPPEHMVSMLRTMGWEIEKKHFPICPDCVEAHKKKKETSVLAAKKNEYATSTVTTEEIPVMANANTNVGPTPKLARKIYQLLDDHFDDTAKRYQAGWDDDMIAKEADTSVDLIRKIRKDAYGELAEDPIITQLRHEVTVLEGKIQNCEDSIMARLVEETKALRNNLASVRNTLDRATDKVSGKIHKA